MAQLTPQEKDVLDLVRSNARMSSADMAKALGSTPKNIDKALAKLESNGVILGYTAIISEEAVLAENPYAVRALVELSIRPEKKTGFEAIASRIYKFPNVISHYLVSGQYDFMVIVEGRTHRDIAAFVFDKLATLENVTATNTHFVFKKYKEHGVVLEKMEQPDRVAIVA